MLFRIFMQEGSISEKLQYLVFALIALVIALTLREFAHALVANLCGDPTSKAQGRLSLNPLRHIDWFGLVMMLVCGFGWAKPVPVDPRYFKRPKEGMALTALAGPVSNFLLAALLMLEGRMIYYHAPYTVAWDVVFNFLMTTAILSIGLGIFNLLPIPPLDGAKVLGGLLPDSAYFTIMRYERYGMLLLILLSLTNVGGSLISGAIGAVYSAMVNILF